MVASDSLDAASIADDRKRFGVAVDENNVRRSDLLAEKAIVARWPEPPGP
jgi:hypothetical protein